MHEPEAKRKLISRLRRIEGQVAAICRMAEEDVHCVDMLLQISAVQGALGKAGQVLLGSHVETCVADAFSKGSKQERQQAIDELMEVFGRYGKIGGR
jgi:DNA-binding FrmR family transcriptional regulator